MFIVTFQGSLKTYTSMSFKYNGKIMVFVLKKLAILLGKGHLCASENETNKAKVPPLQYNTLPE